MGFLFVFHSLYAIKYGVLKGNVMEKKKSVIKEELLNLIIKNTVLSNRLGEIICKINDEAEEKVMQSASNRKK